MQILQKIPRPCPYFPLISVYSVMAQITGLRYNKAMPHTKNAIASDPHRKGGHTLLLCIQTIEDPQERLLFADVYAAYAGRMLALARQKLHAPADAEDAVHQAFLSLAEHFSHLSRLPRPQLEAYLVVVTERKCIDLLRQQSRSSGTPFVETIPLVTPAPCGDALADAMGRLQPRYREALLLRYGYGYSTRETASLLGLSVAAAQKVLQRAKRALQAELEQEEATV